MIPKKELIKTYYNAFSKRFWVTLVLASILSTSLSLNIAFYFGGELYKSIILGTTFPFLFGFHFLLNRWYDELKEMKIKTPKTTMQLTHRK